MELLVIWGKVLSIFVAIMAYICILARCLEWKNKPECTLKWIFSHVYLTFSVAAVLIFFIWCWTK